jgi:hypothetical protein
MDLRPNLGQLKTPQDILRLSNILAEIADELDILYTTSAPNGSISARQGRLALYNSGVVTFWRNTTGSTVWVQISTQADGAAASSGVGSIKMGSTNAADSAGFLKFKKADGTDVFVPYFTDDTP